MNTKKNLILTSFCALLAVILAQPAKAQAINPGIIDPDAVYAGKSYNEWAAGFWRYYMSLT